MDTNNSYSEQVAKMAELHRDIEILAAFKKAEQKIKEDYEKEFKDSPEEEKDKLNEEILVFIMEEARVKVQLEEIQFLEEKSEKEREIAMVMAKKKYEDLYNQLPMYMQSDLPKVEEDKDKTFSHPIYSLDEMKSIDESIYLICKAQIELFHGGAEDAICINYGGNLIGTYSETNKTLSIEDTNSGVGSVFDLSNMSPEEIEEFIGSAPKSMKFFEENTTFEDLVEFCNKYNITTNKVYTKEAASESIKIYENFNEEDLKEIQAHIVNRKNSTKAINNDSSSKDISYLQNLKQNQESSTNSKEFNKEKIQEFDKEKIQEFDKENVTNTQYEDTNVDKSKTVETSQENKVKQEIQKEEIKEASFDFEF